MNTQPDQQQAEVTNAPPSPLQLMTALTRTKVLKVCVTSAKEVMKHLLSGNNHYVFQLHAKRRSRRGMFYGELTVEEADAWLKAVNSDHIPVQFLQRSPCAGDTGSAPIIFPKAVEEHIDGAGARDIVVCIRVSEPRMFGPYFVAPPDSEIVEACSALHFATLAFED